MTETAHTPLVILAGPADCFERECEDFFTEDGEEIPGKDRCTHITEQTICEQCSTEQPDGSYEPTVPWPGPHTTPTAA